MKIRVGRNIPLLRSGWSLTTGPDQEPSRKWINFSKSQGTKYHYVENGSRRQELVLLLHDFSDFWYGWRSQVNDGGMINVLREKLDAKLFLNYELYKKINAKRLLTHPPTQLRGLSGSNWVVAPDLKGFGDSDKPFLARQYKDQVG